MNVPFYLPYLSIFVVFFIVFNQWKAEIGSNFFLMFGYSPIIKFLLYNRSFKKTVVRHLKLDDNCLQLSDSLLRKCSVLFTF